IVTLGLEPFPEVSQGSGSEGGPRAPDGQRIAFSNLEGNPDIYVIPATGGKPIWLNTDSAEDISPSWSKDGSWIYFGSWRTGDSGSASRIFKGFLRRQRWDLFHSNGRSRQEIFYPPVFEFRPKQSESACSDIRLGTLGLVGRTLAPVYPGKP